MSRILHRADAPILLAPAGDPTAAVAALESGADAIYVGLKGWSRGGAKGELTSEELQEVLRAAHARSRRIRVALNTIPGQAERRYLVGRGAELIGWGVEERRAIAQVPDVMTEVMIHMVEEFILLGKSWMPSYYRLNPTPLAGVYGE